MNRKVPYDRGLIIVTLALLGFGLVMVFSASTVVSGDTHVFSRHFAFMLMGLALMLAAMRIDYYVYGKAWVVYALLALTLGLLVATFFSPPVNGVHRWLSIGSFRAQPSEFAKLTMVLFTTHYWMHRERAFSNLKAGLAPYTAIAGPVILLVLAEPDFGTAACISVTCLFLAYLGGLRHRYLGFALLASAPAFYFLVYRVPYRWNRIMAFLDPELNPLGIGYQIRQSLIAVGSGGVKGVGFAQGKQKLAFLPESHTDFIFAIVGEELGLIGCTLLLALFLILFWKGVRVAVRSDTTLGTMLGLGIVGMISFQALFNMSVVISLLPTKGIPLPFISVGGSSLLVTMIGIGILLNISRNGRASGREQWYRPPSPDAEEGLGALSGNA